MDPSIWNILMGGVIGVFGSSLAQLISNMHLGKMSKEKHQWEVEDHYKNQALKRKLERLDKIEDWLSEIYLQTSDWVLLLPELIKKEKNKRLELFNRKLSVTSKMEYIRTISQIFIDDELNSVVDNFGIKLSFFYRHYSNFPKIIDQSTFEEYGVTLVEDWTECITPFQKVIQRLDDLRSIMTEKYS